MLARVSAPRRSSRLAPCSWSPAGSVSSSDRQQTISRASYDAVIFDMDGVVTRTAEVHAAAWKTAFDALLKRRSRDTGEDFVPFDAAHDYLRHVDGKPREDGIRDFLASRGISLPEGGPDDPPEADTVRGVGTRKNADFLDQLESGGVRAFESTVALIHDLKRRGVKVAIISSSKNCAAVTEAAGVAPLFEARVDGVESARLGIPGKPAPEIFLEAARRLGVAAERSVVVEDAISGVRAGSAGRFGLVIGVDRGGNPEALAEAGADIVVPDLEAVSLVD